MATQLPLAGTSELVIQQSSRLVLQPLSPWSETPAPPVRPAGGLGRGVGVPLSPSGGLELEEAKWAGPGPVTLSPVI